MTTANGMTCDVFNDRLMAYLEHETDDATRAAIERHSVSCPECGALLADLRKLRIDSANLPELVPARDLWSGIAARIEAPVVPIGARTVADPRARRLGRFTRGALIAASLVGAAGLGYFAAARRGDDALPLPIGPTVALVPETVYTVSPVGPVDSATTATSGATQSPAAVATVAVTASRTPSVQQVINLLSVDYDREILRLKTLIDQRRNQLDPVTVAIIEKNLQVIDTAITECKKAIARDPSSRFLIESLNQSLQTKVELMRTAALLPSRT